MSDRVAALAEQPSILSTRSGSAASPPELRDPACFGDLNLDQVFGSIAGVDEYDLAPFFRAPLHDVDEVRYRHDVLRDLEQPPIDGAVQTFTHAMRTMREHLAQAAKLRHRYQKERWFLDAVAVYLVAVRSFAADLAPLDLRSRGIRSIRDHVARYVASDAFTSLDAETDRVREALDGVRYCVHIRSGRVTVTAYDGEPDLSAVVEQTFAKFAQGAAADYRVSFSEGAEMNHVEANILDLVARLFPDVFQALDDHAARHQDFIDRTIAVFDREVHFYLGYLGLIAPLKAGGLRFCYPEVSTRDKGTLAVGAFDLALATKRAYEDPIVVPNDLSLTGPERILVVTGPNQGGKTTFARMFGQLHYLASLGYPVPGSEARVFLPDQLFTHFEREEDITTLSGKLQEELVRVHEILDAATSGSVIVMNESFTSTTLRDALFLGQAVMKRIIDLDLLCVYVTFVDELASLGEATVSMVSTVVPDDPTSRTYRIVRKPADGLAYAAAIAEKYGLTYRSLKTRLAP